MRQTLRFLGFLACTAAAAGLRPAVAHACTCGSGPIFYSEPASGAAGLERNRAIIVVGQFIPGSISLETEAGEPVAFTSYEGPTPYCPLTWADVVPKKPLAPETGYRISVAPQYPMRSDASSNTITFTTGTELLVDEPLARPAAKASVWVDVRAHECTTIANGVVCMAIDDPLNVEVVARDGEQVLSRFLISGRDWLTFASAFTLNGAPNCIELRRRSATGKRSAPRKICDGSLIVQHGSGRPWPGCSELTLDVPNDGGVHDGHRDAEAEPPAPDDARTPGQSPTPEAGSAKHRAWGCSAIPVTGSSSSAALALLVFALAAHSGRRRLLQE